MDLVGAFVNCELLQSTCDDIVDMVPAAVNFLSGMNWPTLARADWMEVAACDDHRSVSR
jgi:hypothetical protein